MTNKTYRTNNKANKQLVATQNVMNHVFFPSRSGLAFGVAAADEDFEPLGDSLNVDVVFGFVPGGGGGKSLFLATCGTFG